MKIFSLFLFVMVLKFTVLILSGMLRQDNEFVSQQNRAFCASPKNSRNRYNQFIIKNLISSSKSPLLSNIFTFRKLWASLLFLLILHISTYMQTTSASPLNHFHSLSLNPSTSSVPRRSFTRRLPVYPLPASSSNRGSTVTVYPIKSRGTSRNYHQHARRGRPSQSSALSSRRQPRVQTPKHTKEYFHKNLREHSPFERLTSNVAKARPEDRKRRELEDYENYADYDDIAANEASDNTKAEKELYLEELFVTKEKWVNPCGINFSSVIPLDHVNSPDYEYEPLTDSELLQQIVIQVTKALRQSRRFKEDYVSTIYFIQDQYFYYILHSSF